MEYCYFNYGNILLLMDEEAGHTHVMFSVLQQRVGGVVGGDRRWKRGGTPAGVRKHIQESFQIFYRSNSSSMAFKSLTPGGNLEGKLQTKEVRTLYNKIQVFYLEKSTIVIRYSMYSTLEMFTE